MIYIPRPLESTGINGVYLNYRPSGSLSPSSDLRMERERVAGVTDA